MRSLRRPGCYTHLAGRTVPGRDTALPAEDSRRLRLPQARLDQVRDRFREIEARMQAEVEVQKLKQNLEREKVQADIAVTQATGRANSIRAEAQAQADEVETLLAQRPESPAGPEVQLLSLDGTLIQLVSGRR